MIHLKPLTPNEAGYVVGRSSAAVNRAVDKGVIKAKLQRQGARLLRQFGLSELRYLALESEVEKNLTPAGRRRVYNAVRLLAPGAHRVVLGVVEFDLTSIDRRISEQLARLDEIKDLVDASGAEPVLRGTTIPVHAVAALVRGQGEAQTLKDYPSLTPAQVRSAVDYAKLYPRRGRPYPAKSLKGMLADLADTGLWDMEDR